MLGGSLYQVYAIKEAVKIYAQQNETFKQNMSDDFKHLIYNN